MSSTIELSPPPAEKCLETSRVSRYRGGTVIAEDVEDMTEHRRRLADVDRYRPAHCGRCGGAHVHVHTRPVRKPRGDSSLPAAIPILQFRCAECGATWRVLPRFLARHLWHPWSVIERHAAETTPKAKAVRAAAIAGRTVLRWAARLASSARTLVVLLAASGATLLERVAQDVGLLATRHELVAAFAGIVRPRAGSCLAALGAIVQRLERGIRLV